MIWPRLRLGIGLWDWSLANLVIAFWHPSPSYKIHILLVPKKAIKNITSLKPDDSEYLDEVFKIAREIVTELDLEKDGYTLLANGGAKQAINQLHFHLFQ